MGCGASANNGNVTAMLQDVHTTVKKDPSRFTATDATLLQNIATAAGTTIAATSSPSLVQETWDRIVSIVDPALVGERVLAELFRIQPMAEIIFYDVSVTRQGAAVARMLAQVVKVERQSAVLVSTFLSLGARHALFGVEADVLGDLQLAAMSVFNDILDGMSEEETNAWNHVWRTVIDLMTHGLRSPAGLANKEKFELMASKMVQTCWHKIRLMQIEGPEEMRLFTRIMYVKVLTHRPDFRRFSNLTDFRTADRIMNFLTITIDNICQGIDTSDMMRECGARHVAYNVTVEDMMAFEPPFLETCDQYLGSDMTPPIRLYMSRFWRLLVDGLAAGMNLEMDGAAQLAPQGEEIAIVFTDIEKSTRLWEANPTVMSAALDAHNRVLRRLIQQYKGYEIKTIGDSFMVAFHNMVDATLFGCAIQVEIMMLAPIAPGFKMVRPTQGGGPSEMWDESTMRVRVGIEWCKEISPQYDPVHRRFDYFGPSVNVAARVEGLAAGGQVLMTATAVQQLQYEERCRTETAPRDFVALRASEKVASPKVADAIVIALAGKSVELKGVASAVDLYSVLPVSLSKRTFEPVKRTDASSAATASAHLRPSAKGLGKAGGGSAASATASATPSSSLPGSVPVAST